MTSIESFHEKTSFLIGIILPFFYNFDNKTEPLKQKTQSTQHNYPSSVKEFHPF